MNHPHAVMGERLGLAFPPTPADLLAAGPEFLTRGMHATGALAADNRVTRITSAQEFVGGGMGRKLAFDVAYARDAPDLPTELFAKFPRDFGDPLREVFAPLMAPEVRFALLSRAADFPVTTPRCAFADYDPQTRSGLLVTERIAYGRDGIEPCHDKALDYRMADPLPYYQALTRALARLAAWRPADGARAQIDALFPFDPDAADAGARIAYTPAQLEETLARLQAFAAAAPQLFEPQLLADGFLQRFVAEAPLVLRHEAAIRRRLNHARDCVALCHWNLHLDNAWFRRDAQGALHVGLLDWGAVGQMNLAQAFFGMTCAAETGFLEAHRAGLVGLLLDTYAASGGPVVGPDDFADMLALSVALLGVAWLLDAPALVAREIPDYASLSGRRDPRLEANFLARAQLQVLMVFLNEWRCCRPADAIRALAG